LRQAAEAHNGVNLVRDIVMFQKSREYSASAESVGVERDEYEYWWGEGMARFLQVSVEFRYE
jgi:hypothetical protein